MLPKSRKKALVLSGGGGRGAYHVGVLRFLHEHEWVPDVVVGTSIGAVNGAALASGHTYHSLWALWQRLTTSDVQWPNLNPLNGNFLLNTAPLRETLEKEKWLNFDRINSNEAAVHLRVTATEVNTGELHVFGNSSDESSICRNEPITLDHIIASCSIPLVYPATKLNERIYWDGATVSNTPLGSAIHAGGEDIVVVLMTPFNDEAAVETPDNLVQAAGVSLDWALLASFRSDLKMFRWVNKWLKMKIENDRLRYVIDQMAKNVDRADAEANYEDLNNDGIPDFLEKEAFRILPDPVVVSPREMISAAQIVSYTLDGHAKMYRMGYEDAKRAWIASGRSTE